MALQTRTETIRELLHRHGLRYSKPRESILRFFRETRRHVSADELHAGLEARGDHVSLSTVYLNLGVLKEAGILREVAGVHGEALYDGNPSPHYHLICRRTGRVLDVPAIDVDGVPLGRFLKERIEAATGWSVEEPQFDLRGVSPEEPPERGRGDPSSTPG